jgi:hypothetical protein
MKIAIHVGAFRHLSGKVFTSTGPGWNDPKESVDCALFGIAPYPSRRNIDTRHSSLGLKLKVFDRRGEEILFGFIV